MHSGPCSDRQALAEIVVEQRSIGWDQMARVEGLYTYLGLGLHADVVGLHNSSGLGLMALEAPVTAMEPRLVVPAAAEFHLDDWNRSKMPHSDQLEGSSLARKADGQEAPDRERNREPHFVAAEHMVLQQSLLLANCLFVGVALAENSSGAAGQGLDTCRIAEEPPRHTVT